MALIGYRYESAADCSPNRRTQEALGRTGAPASRQYQRAVQRVWHAGLPMQRSQEAAPARAVLSAELYLAGQEQHAIRAAGGPARDAPEGGQLQAAAGTGQRVGGAGDRTGEGRAGGGEAGPWRLIATSCRKILPPCGRWWPVCWRSWTPRSAGCNSCSTWWSSCCAGVTGRSANA